MEKKKYIFKVRLDVRNYERDIRGIINDTNYLHYTEHTRHRFFKSLGVSFSEFREKGADAVAARIQLTHKMPSTCDDEIISRMSLKKNGLRWAFSHDLSRASDECPCFHAGADLMTLINGKLGSSKGYDKASTRVL